MKICYVTEMGNEEGPVRVPRNYPAMKTEIAWPCTLEADCILFDKTPNQKYDLAIVIIPKHNIENWIKLKVLDKVKTYATKLAIMQEGPNWFFQDYNLQEQVWYYNCLQKADILLCHNKSDQKYYQGLIENKPVLIMPTLMIEDALPPLPKEERKGVIIGGNFVSWYGGFDSFAIAKCLNEPIFAPSMGRRQEGEEQLGITHLPFLDWRNWMLNLNKFKYGIHLMRTHAAGTFALNCAYLGIPCIGYKGLDTQETCHPDLSVDLGDLVSARKMIRTLRDDEDFYNACSEQAKSNYVKYYHEDIFNSTFKKQLEVS